MQTFRAEPGCDPRQMDEHLLVLTAKQIFDTRHGFEMIWTDAVSDSTEMVDIKSVADRPDRAFV